MFALRSALPLVLGLLAMIPAAFAASPDTRCFEMRTYYAPAGKLEALHARFRNHTMRLFEKHGMTNVGYWTPLENPENKLVYVLAYSSRDAREQAWKEFQADPDWVAAKTESEKDGKLVEKVESLFLQGTDFSPEIRFGLAAGTPRVYELRTYITTPGNQDRLLKRFREHTLELFKRHGMTNLAYWTLQSGQPGADKTLIYMLAHASKEAGGASFKEFRADPEWIAAKTASETEGGGSLTIEPDGVKSVYLQATDYSPTH